MSVRFAPDTFTDFTATRLVSFMPSYWHTNALCAAVKTAIAQQQDAAMALFILPNLCILCSFHVTLNLVLGNIKKTERCEVYIGRAILRLWK